MGSNLLRGRRGGVGGGGLHFRSPVDVFADAAARTAAFGTGGTLAGQHEQFVTDRSLAIVIGTIANPTAFQTYTGASGTYDDAAWLNRTDAVQGRQGPRGVKGDPGSAEGLPSFLVNSGIQQASDDLISGTIMGRTDALPNPSLLFMRLPNPLNRATDDMRLEIGGTPTAPLLSYDGTPIKARDLTAWGLIEIVYGRNRGGDLAYIIPFLPPRPQDYQLAVGWVHLSLTPPLQVELDGFLGLTTNQFLVQDLQGPFNPADPNTRDYIWMGVPEDAPWILQVQPFEPAAGPYLDPRFWEFQLVDTSLQGNPMFNGVQYRWWRTQRTVLHTDMSRVLLTYAPYFD